MKTSPLVASLLAAAVCVTAGVLIFQTPPPSENPPPPVAAAQRSPMAEKGNPAPAIPQSAAPAASADNPAPSTSSPPPPSIAATPEPPAQPSAFRASPAKVKRAKNPAARLALEFVGIDPEAGEIWLAAINDPALPANERKDLIEDLNEDGLWDPKRPTQDDLRLIQSRLAIIEKLLPTAMDQVNAEAFREARKDLANMHTRLTGQ